jgi:hypothetical protein
MSELPDNRITCPPSLRHGSVWTRYNLREQSSLFPPCYLQGKVSSADRGTTQGRRARPAAGPPLRP